MANPHKGEVSLVLFEDDPNIKRRSYTLKFNTAGQVEMENWLDLENSEIAEKLFGLGPDGRQKMGSRLTAGLLLGATRRHHARELPTIYDIFELMDEVEEAEDSDAETIKIGKALVAAYTKSNPDEIEAEIMGQEPGENGSEANGSKAAPKDQDKPTRKPKAPLKQKAAKDSGSTS